MSRAVIRATIDDAVPTVYSREEADAIIAGYPAHEREARSKGIPALGSGRIFPIDQEMISVPAFPIPDHWWQVCGIDFGWDHPTAGARLAHDRDADIIYVTHSYKRSEGTPMIHAHALKPWGSWLPWMWPHDGLQHDKGSGLQLAKQYRDEGLQMHHERVTFEDGSNGVEAGLMEMLDRMETGRWRVFSHLQEWFDEFLLYHRKDGKVVKEYDDLMSASRYALMGKRFSVQNKQQSKGTVSQIMRERSGSSEYSGIRRFAPTW